MSPESCHGLLGRLLSRYTVDKKMLLNQMSIEHNPRHQHEYCSDDSRKKDVGQARTAIRERLPIGLPIRHMPALQFRFKIGRLMTQLIHRIGSRQRPSFLSPLSPGLAEERGRGRGGRAARYVCQSRSRSSTEHGPGPASLDIPVSAAECILVWPGNGHDVCRARDLRQFDVTCHLPRRSASRQHNKSRPCRVESDTRDETSGFDTLDCERFATRHAQTR